MSYEIIDAVSPEGVEFQYLLVDDTWQVPMTEENPMYQAYLNKDTLASELVDPAPTEKPAK